MQDRKKVVIVGGGFGGLTAAKRLKKSKHNILLIDRTNHHVFQPLLYQVATAALSPGDIAVPIRSVFHNSKNVEIIMSEAVSVNTGERYLNLKSGKIFYDYLILAPGASHSYFGNNNWEDNAPGLKTLNDALLIRENILRSLEEAELTNDKTKREKFLTYVVIGGGPTGVEMAGSIAEIAKQTMMKDFTNIKADETKVVLVEAADRLLTAYPEKLSEAARKDLEEMGVIVKTAAKVTDVKTDEVILGKESIKTSNIIWAAGNEASPLLKSIDCELDRAGRVVVDSDLTVKGHDNIFIIGDAAHVNNENGELLPGIAPVAMQQGRYAAEIIAREVPKQKRKPFKYFDKGTMATIGRARAIAKIRRFEFSGFFAWFLWSFIHIFFLITFRNRFRVMAEWIWYYFTSRRGVRLITGRRNGSEKSD